MRGRGAVVVERLALEVADADVPELLVDEVRHITTRERDVGRLQRARERRDRDEGDRQRRELAGEPPRLLDALLRKPAVESRIAVYDFVDVEERLPVAREEEQPHRRRLSRGRPLRCNVPHARRRSRPHAPALFSV